MSKLLEKPKSEQFVDFPAKFQRFNLIENPFPSEPVVNKDSNDKRINGDIYETEIRRKEYEQLETFFLKQPLSSPNHLRLGYIIDSSYIGRGNGKSAFLVNLFQDINKNFCLDLSNGVNKCFAVYVTPEPGGRTKTFSSFVDTLFQSILRSNIIKKCLAILRLEAITEINANINIEKIASNDEELIESLNSNDWFEKNNISVNELAENIFQNKYLQDLPSHFPLFVEKNLFGMPLVREKDFEQYYAYTLKKGKDRFDFVFTHLVKLFQAASFNGSFVLVDDYERIPDFQSTRQKRDFALELRSSLFDGFYKNAKLGFYNFLLVLHAGVPRLISEAWAESGMENRAPIAQQLASKHVVRFEKLNKGHAVLLLKKYLEEYRIDTKKHNELYPFTEDSVSVIGELSEYNAAKILKMAYDLLDRASQINDLNIIDEQFVRDNRGILDDLTDKSAPSIEGKEPTDLLEKAKGKK